MEKKVETGERGGPDYENRGFFRGLSKQVKVKKNEEEDLFC